MTPEELCRAEARRTGRRRQPKRLKLTELAARAGLSREAIWHHRRTGALKAVETRFAGAKWRWEVEEPEAERFLRERVERKPAEVDPEAWLICETCPDGDNEWPPSAFTACGRLGRKGRKLQCNDCFEKGYPRRRTRCSGCGKKMETRGKCEPRCRKCRKADTTNEGTDDERRAEAA